MGWDDYHLHMFTIKGQIFGDPTQDEYGDLNTKSEKHYHLNKLITTEGEKFLYEYDFGDGWIHSIVLEKIQLAKLKNILGIILSSLNPNTGQQKMELMIRITNQ